MNYSIQIRQVGTETFIAQYGEVEPTYLENLIGVGASPSLALDDLLTRADNVQETVDTFASRTTSDQEAGE